MTTHSAGLTATEEAALVDALRAPHQGREPIAEGQVLFLVEAVNRVLVAHRGDAPAPVGTTTDEWAVDHPSGVREENVPETLARPHVSKHPEQTLLRRRRTTYPDHVTEWEPA